jgi:hypothetical protein
VENEDTTKGENQMVEIKKINTRKEEGVALLKEDTIVAICQQPKHFTRLYDDNGNLVSETEDSPWYAIITNCGQTYIIDDAEYQRLKALLK